VSKVEFTWERAETAAGVMIRERMVGTSLVKEYGPIPPPIVAAFIRARRDIVARFASKNEAVKIFTPQS